ncbi:hypothetical protein PATSB16_25760 [Pandoraea thiooxydans]|nr:entericidin A/B family lipoprotein [Pandoraea thiooxydans]APD30430.1 entericidin [Pandoraea thiooxydans]APR95916.1 hypothetical protein PATSB16_25760 [Pandoraea thiooxydans]
MKKLFLLALALVSVMLAGCNTVAGIGKDTAAAGHAIENAAQK